MYLHSSMQDEDVLEHTYIKCHLCTLYAACRPSCNIGIHLNNIIEHTHAKILVNASECQVSRGDTNDEVVDR
jgi:L-lactate utilization protein LutB